MRGVRGDRRARVLAAAAVVLAVGIAGDRSAYTASAANSGMDPFDVLDLQVKPYVSIVFDTSGSMKNTPTIQPGMFRHPVGGDDPGSRMWQAKRALRDVSQEFRTRLNMGLLTFSPLLTSKEMVDSQEWDGDGRRDGALHYVSNSPAARLWYWDPNTSGTLEYEQDTHICPLTSTVGSSNIRTVSGGSTTVTAVFGTPFTNLRVGDALVANGLTRVIVTKASNSQVTVDSAVDWYNSNNGYSFNYYTGQTGYFCDLRNANSDYNDAADFTEVYRSFGNRAYFSVPFPWKSRTGPGFGGVSPAPPTWKTGTDAASIIGYSAFNPDGWMPGAPPPQVPEAAPNNAFFRAYRVPECDPLQGECRYYLASRVYRTNKKFLWNLGRASATAASKLSAVQDFDCSTVPPPAGLVDDTYTGARPCIVFADAADPNNPDKTAVFYYTSVLWTNTTGGGCQSPVLLEPVPPCDPPSLAPTAADNVAAFMAQELPTSGSDPFNMLPSTIGSANPTIAPSLVGLSVNGFGEGIRSDGGTPIYNALNYIQNNDVFPSPPVLPAGVTQQRYVLVITDGEDRCAPGWGTAAGTQALATTASSLYYQGRTSPTATVPNPRRQGELFFVVFTSDASAQIANYVAQAGSGAQSPSSWADTSETLTCPTGANCRNAIRAFNIDDLKIALRQAFSSIANSGEFASARGTVADDVYEFAAIAGATFSADDPRFRYATTMTVQLQANIFMPGFEGRLRAYRPNPPGTAVLAWEAGQKLKQRVTDVMGPVSCPGIPVAGSPRCTGEYTFADLHGGAAPPPRYVPSTTAMIRRRIFTTERNGVAPGIVPLWPPTTDAAGVAPDDVATYPPGLLDGSATNGTALAIGGLSFLALQNEFGACTGAPLPADCSDPARQQLRALKEAREIILAFTAGADLSRDVAGDVRRDTTGELLFKARPWLLADSTVATPAIVGPPATAQPKNHAPEYRLYTDGFRDVENRLIGTNPVDNGFGVTNPDLDDPTAASDPDKRPMMTVAYLGTNHMLHAFRAGPQSCPTAATCPATGAEGGGEELWGFVPYDQLPKLQVRRRGQSRGDSVYVMASSARFGDVFVPGNYTGPDGRTYPGRWRTGMYVGRGPGGKYITALDVTGVGPFTRTWDQTNLPTVFWSRGNPDTTNGLTTGTPNASTTTADAGVTDQSGYLSMGETWSVGALVPVDQTRTFGREWIYWVGSGFSDMTGEGTTFYTLDALTGDVLYTADVGSNPSATRTNFLSANVTGFVPSRVYCGDPQDYFAVAGPATAAYVGDLHGRLWKFGIASLSTPVLVADFGPDQPLGSAVAVENVYQSGVLRPYIYGVTGSDQRVAVPPAATPPFRLFGIRDDLTTFTVVFTRDLPERFRGTVQPLVLEVCSGGVPTIQNVFFAGTQFNSALAATNCASGFDSVLFALTATTGLAAYDLNAAGTDEYAIWRGQKVLNISSDGSGRVTLDKGIGAGTPPPPPAPPAPRTPFAVPAVSVLGLRFGSPVCN